MSKAGEQYFELAAMAESPRVAKDGFFACLCCETYTLTEAGGWEICDICGWEDDPVQEAHPQMAGGANGSSLEEARENYHRRISRQAASGHRTDGQDG